VSAAARRSAREVEIAGRRVVLTNEAKVLYPAAGFTKGDLVRWVLAVAPALLPHLADRPVTLARFPDGVDGPGWYQTRCPAGAPAWLRTVEVAGRGRPPVRYCLLDDAAGLAWAANTGAIELHPVLAPASGPARARALVVDLDPTPPAALLDCARVALLARAALAADGLDALVKTSGGKGLHVQAPLGGEPFPAARAYARALAERLAALDPGVTAELARRGRSGKVLVDWRQNEAGRSLIAPWSLRAATVPLVATPVAWSEVEAALQAADEGRLRFSPGAALDRLKTDGDLHGDLLRGSARLPG
jgi:bifunctional non-homologous end joining protein LigD